MLELKKRPKSPYWIARGTFEGRRVEISTKHTKLSEAKASLPGILAELSLAAVAQPEDLIFDRALALYREKRPDVCILKPVIAHFTGMPLKGITNVEMRKAAAALYPDAASSTVRRQLYTPIKAILNSAAEDDLFVAPRLKAPTGGKKRTEFMLPEEASALLDALGRDQNAYLAPLVTFLLGQGCRMGETLALQGSDVSVKNRFAILRHTKNGEERRASLIPKVVGALASLPTIGKPGPLFRRCDGAGFRHGDASGGQIAKAFSRAVALAGLDPTKITPHVCRHTWATWFYAQTKDVRRLQDEGGWKSGEWQRYTKLGTPDLGRSALAVGWDFSEEVPRHSPAKTRKRRQTAA